MKFLNRPQIEWIWYFLWALFVNACNFWLITPVVEDYAMLGIIAVFALAVLWVLSIPVGARRKWISFTVFSLLLGQGMSGISMFEWSMRVKEGLILSIGLVLVVWLVARVRVFTAILTAAGLIVANLLLPMSAWPFLTHFRVAYSAVNSLTPSDMPALPLVVEPTPSGQALLTLTLAHETKDDVQQAVSQAGTHGDSLQTVISSFQHRYTFVKISQSGKKVTASPASSMDLAAADPNAFVSALFPLSRAYWAQDLSGQLIQYMAPSTTPLELTQMAVSVANVPANMTALAERSEQAEQKNWSQFLNTIGVTWQHPSLQVQNNVLVGTFQGHKISVPVLGDEIIGSGSFTAAGTHQVLIEGANVLQVVSLDGGTGQVVSTHRAPTSSPIPNDVKVGAIDNSGRDAILVNDVPAYILQAEPAGPWKRLYTAPNATFRFEAAMKLGNDVTPEIITDDPSYMRNSPTRYFSSYTYRSVNGRGELIRNWRVYHTNVVNVTPVQFSKNGPTYIAADIYATGELVVLLRHDLPVVPAASILLGCIIAYGFLLRIVGRRRRVGHA